MEHYRAYLIGLDGHFLKVVDIVTENDETASQRAPTCRRPRRGAMAAGAENRAVQAQSGVRPSQLAASWLSSAPGVARLSELDPVSGNSQPRLFVERADRLGRFCVAFLGLPAEPVCFAFGHGYSTVLVRGLSQLPPRWRASPNYRSTVSFSQSNKDCRLQAIACFRVA
jgi:hypothetical protein